MNHLSLATTVAAALLLLAGTSHAADAKSMSEDDKVFYYLGTALSSNLAPLNLTDDELVMVQEGLRDALAGSAIELDEATYGQRLNDIAQQRMAATAVREEAAARDYIEKMAAEEGADTTASGIVILELQAGSGASPNSNSTVTAHYHGTLRDGTVFDSSVKRGQPFTSSLERVIPCWREAIPTMKEGGKSKITCPPELAYGERGSGAIPGGSALTFEVELIEVVE
ncbi:MAG: FKBP-type peptidyl-prolyl cis-trans isomerase [Gammaproteobacteria bacterium]|nr:FKBP-type peptidyl-prolyl cis-trans isomerase [Gammaproteobacteria bacterium]MBT8443957.1 FKBP-type peptidyl-prolyl cis-trans isomerase [Gammaproteobacteria bacterium]NND36166.1 FKBP-type peptidyl-prolyl cis-trans isomerase [Gammaproteobacteria bacterium]